jgi:hypothetical protein
MEHEIEETSTGGTNKDDPSLEKPSDTASPSPATVAEEKK